MSQVLEKPILLDETGQDIASKINGIGGKLDSQTTGIGNKLDTNSAAIVNKLNDIKEAIGTSSEFIPVMIKVVTPPTKTLYNVGERLNLSGMVVNLIGSNGVQIDVTQACTFVPANNTVLTSANTSVAITYHYAADNIDFSTSQALTIRALDSIAVTTPPIKTAYQTGETLDLTGIVVTATYSDGYTANVTSDCTFAPANGTVLSQGDTSVTVTYTEGGTTKTTTVAIGVKELTSISVTHLPTKTSYHAGETLDLTGIVVSATYDDTSSVDVTARCTYSPDDGDTLTTSDTSVSISYTEGTITKTTSQVISVKELSSIAITTPPTKTSYVSGEALDLTGIVVTATYSDSSTENVTSLCTFSPANGTTLTGADTTVTVSFTDGATTKTTTQALTVVSIYGVEWDGTATTSWTRTGDAADFVDPVPQMSDGNNGWTTGSSPFDSIQPWSGMQIVEDSTAGSLVSIPKFWYKLTQNPTTHNLKIEISSVEMDGFSVSPAHMDRGDGEGERDTIYVGRYHCDNNNRKSRTGENPYRGAMTNAISFVHDVGSDIWLWDFTTRFTIWLLYLVEFADWNSQDCIGYGCGNTSSVERVGYTDNMTYHTGTTKTNKSTYGTGTQYRNIEGLWDNVYDWIGGCYYDASGLNIILNPSDFYNDLASGGVAVGVPSSSNPSQFTLENVSGAFPLFIPTISDGSDSTYSCDNWSFGSSKPFIFGGGNYSQTLSSGLFCIKSQSGSASTTGIGCRLMKLPVSS